MTDKKDDVISAFIKARDNLYEHLGFKKEWIVYPHWTMYPLCFETLTATWYIRNETVIWQQPEYDDPLGVCTTKIYKHRFYPNGSVFRGLEFTMVFGKSDNMTLAYVFRNENEAKDEACFSPKST